MENEKPVHKVESPEPIRREYLGEPARLWRTPNETNPALQQGIGGASLRTDVWTVTVGCGGNVVCQAGHSGTRVVVDGMVGRSCDVNRGDLSPIDGTARPKVKPGVDGVRSQSPHSSDEPRNK